MASNPYVNKVQLADGTSIMDISDTTAIASDVLNSKYFYTASGQKVRGTATDDHFIITLSKNNNDEWTPDCTYSELCTAYNANKNISMNIDEDYIDYCVVADAYVYEKQGGVITLYGFINEYFYEEESPYNSGVNVHEVIWDSTGFSVSISYPSYETNNADALPSDVASGKIFFNANGIQVGTLPANNTFVVEISKDNNDDWIPDKTFSEISAAYSANKDIYACVDFYLAMNGVSVSSHFDNLIGNYYYTVHELENGIVHADTIQYDYVLDSNNEISLMYEYRYIYPNFQTRAVSYTPTETQQTATITAGSGYNGLQEVNVTVGAISSSYVGSGITRRSSSDLSASGATVTVPSGYYENQATQSVTSGSATTPATSITANPSISINSSGLITASVSGSQSVTPTVSAGYVSSGTAGTVSVSGSATEQLTTQGATTITPTTAAQTVSANTYLTGQLTVSGDVNLVAGNIKKDVSIFGVTGTYEGSGGGTGAVSVVDTLDAHGGTIRTITGVDISDTTAVASDVAQGKYFYTAQGQKTVGTASGGGITPSATHHTIHLEFTDSTDTDVDVYYNDANFSALIATSRPSTYNNKTVVLAQLDNVTWYEVANIPIGVQLIDFNSVTNGYIVDSQGELVESTWSACSDYTQIDPSMTFSYIGYCWYNIVFFDENYDVVGTLYMYNDADSIDNDCAHGTLNSNKMPADAVYCRINTLINPSNTELSLIRTA